VSAGHHELSIAVVDEASAKRPNVNAKIFAAASCLDRHFPKACDAKGKVVVWITDQGAGRLGQPPALSDGPQQYMRIEQQPH
jgi:hypothetical protein